MAAPGAPRPASLCLLPGLGIVAGPADGLQVVISVAATFGQWLDVVDLTCRSNPMLSQARLTQTVITHHDALSGSLPLAAPSTFYRLAPALPGNRLTFMLFTVSVPLRRLVRAERLAAWARRLTWHGYHLKRKRTGTADP